MATKEVGVGVDVSKDTLEVATSDLSVTGSYANTVEGLGALVGALAGVAVHRVVLEASGGYERLALTALHAAGLAVVLVEPARARHFARGLGKRAKTDAIDAAVLARMAEVAVSDNPLWEPLEDEVADLGSVLERRRQLLVLRDAEMKRRRLVRDIVRPQLEESIADLTRKVLALDQLANELIARSTRLGARVAVLESVAGVGRVTAASLVHLVPELGRLTRGAIASLVGVAPMNRDSGTWTSQRYLRGGRQEPRAVLYMAALAATRWNPVIKARYLHLVERGKKPKVALVACMRKLLIHLNALLRAHLDPPDPAPVAA
jgi:transposase